jgi:hypothetical protein
LIPMHKWLYVSMFVVVNFWTVLIHDGKPLLTYSFGTDREPFYLYTLRQLPLTLGCHQYHSSPHRPSLVFQLQLWSILHILG